MDDKRTREMMKEAFRQADRRGVPGWGGLTAVMNLADWAAQNTSLTLSEFVNMFDSVGWQMKDNNEFEE